MTTTNSRREKKEESKVQEKISGLLISIRKIIPDIELDPVTGKLVNASIVKMMIDNKNSEYNKWATNYNKISKLKKARFNAIRDIGNHELRSHEYSLFFDLVSQKAFEEHEMSLIIVNQLRPYVSEAYHKGLTIEETVRIIVLQRETSGKALSY